MMVVTRMSTMTLRMQDNETENLLLKVTKCLAGLGEVTLVNTEAQVNFGNVDIPWEGKRRGHR